MSNEFWNRFYKTEALEGMVIELTSWNLLKTRLPICGLKERIGSVMSDAFDMSNLPSKEVMVNNAAVKELSSQLSQEIMADYDCKNDEMQSAILNIICGGVIEAAKEVNAELALLACNA